MSSSVSSSESWHPSVSWSVVELWVQPRSPVAHASPASPEVTESSVSVATTCEVLSPHVIALPTIPLGVVMTIEPSEYQESLSTQTEAVPDVRANVQVWLDQ